MPPFLPCRVCEFFVVEEVGISLVVRRRGGICISLVVRDDASNKPSKSSFRYIGIDSGPAVSSIFSITLESFLARNGVTVWSLKCPMPTLE